MVAPVKIVERGRRPVAARKARDFGAQLEHKCLEFGHRAETVQLHLDKAEGDICRDRVHPISPAYRFYR